MSYFIFVKNLDNVSSTNYKIAENEYDLNSLNIIKSDYKIIEDSQDNFNLVKYGIKKADKYVNNSIVYIDTVTNFISTTAIKSNGETLVIVDAKDKLKNYIDQFKNNIKQFLTNNPNHTLFNRWNDYFNQLNSLDLNSITYPLNTSLEQYFNDQNKTSLNPLQLP